MHHLSLIHPAAIELWPSGTDGKPVEDLFNIRLRYKDSADWQHLLRVHVPKSAKRHFDAGVMQGFALAPLMPNSRAALAFGEQPRSVLLGVELSDGSRIDCTPPSLKREFLRQVLIGAVLVTTGAAAAIVFDSALAAAVAGLSTHFWRTAASTPRRANW